ncbi:MAG TPA: DUF1573 domain-containing protein [Pirellulales bacterium]|nr:DUF1573 domain-containing protein [Pirellulales bacterium]
MIPQRRASIVYAVMGAAIGCIAYAVGSPVARRPILFLDADVIEIKTLSVGGTVSRTVKIRNNGNLALEIESVSSTCGCSRTSVSRTSVPPNECAELRIDVTGRHGMNVGQIAKIAIATNDKVRPILVIPVIIEEMAGFTVVPSLVDFGVLAPANLPATRRLYIVDSGRPGNRSDVMTLHVDTHANWLTVKEEAHDKLRGEWIVDLELGTNAPREHIAAEMSISLSKDTGASCFEQAVSAVGFVQDRKEAISIQR